MIWLSDIDSKYILKQQYPTWNCCKCTLWLIKIHLTNIYTFCGDENVVFYAFQNFGIYVQNKLGHTGQNCILRMYWHWEMKRHSSRNFISEFWMEIFYFWFQLSCKKRCETANCQHVLYTIAFLFSILSYLNLHASACWNSL